MSVQTRLAMFINAEVRDLESAEPIINAFRCRSVYRICYEFQSIDRTDERIYPSKFSLQPTLLHHHDATASEPCTPLHTLLCRE